MALILPKGIVVNSESISGDIGRIDREPLADEEISKLWKVYTTTKRRLKDPTAERLENYWWRIWGSRARSLRGSTVARLFAEISDGETFVPLQSPANRDESGDSSGRPLLRDSKTSSTTEIPSTSKDEASKPRQSSISSKGSGALPPPILKKSRGPSNNGPRPTARFISPHSSEDEKDESESEAQLAVKDKSQLAVPSPTLEPPRAKKKEAIETAAAPRRKSQGHIAVTAGHKRRPGIARRPSSQSSAGSENGTKTQDNMPLLAEAEMEDQPENLGVPKRTLGTSTRSSSKFQESFSLSPDTRIPEQAKQPGQRPTSRGSSKSSPVRKAVDSQQVNSTKACMRTTGIANESDTSSHDESDSAVQSNDTASKQKFAGKNMGSGSHGTQSQNSRLSEKSTTVQKQNGNTNHTKPQSKAARSLSEHNLPSAQPALLPKLGSKSPLRLAPTTQTTATGTVDFAFAARLPVTDVSLSDEQTNDEKGKEKETDTLFSKRPVKLETGSPVALVAPSSASSKESLSRSKSQLTLLLEKDKAHTKKNKESGSKRREKSR